MFLAEKNFLPRAFGRTPQLDPPLQGPDLPVLVPTGMLALEPLK
jgi:hypothetical protein